MAKVTINDSREYVELGTLGDGDYFILNGDLYLVTDDFGGYNNYLACYNLSKNEEREEIDNETKVLLISSENVQIKVEI